MPVTIKPAGEEREVIENALARILNDIPSDHLICQTVRNWLDDPSSLHLWWAIFNDRIVGFLLVDSTEIKAIAVHPATRSRGVGRRAFSLIKEQYPELGVAPAYQAMSLFEAL